MTTLARVRGRGKMKEKFFFEKLNSLYLKEMKILEKNLKAIFKF